MGLKIASLGASAAPMRKQKVSLCMIMKNEEEHLARCLTSVKGVADEIIIVDTGSTDASVEIAESFGATVLHEEWINDFAHHRNTGLEHATGDWILVLDADEELIDGTKLLPFLNDPAMDGYLFREVNFVGDQVGADSVVNSAFRIFRNKPHHRYVGALHEQIYAQVDHDCTRSQFIPVEIFHYGYLDHTTESKNKKARNMGIVLEEVKRKPNDSFTLFNAGVEFQRIGDHATAIDYFMRSFKNLSDLRMNFSSLLLRNMVAALCEMERFDEALQVVVDALEAYPEYTDLVYLKGQIHTGRREFRAAIAEFRKAIEMGDHRGDRFMAQSGMGSYISWFALGVVHHSIGDVGQAVACFRRAISTCSGFYPPPLVRLTHLVMERENTADSIAFLRTVMPDARRADALRTVAEVLLSDGHFEECIGLVDEALALDSHMHACRVVRAHALIAVGRYDDAVRTIEEVPATSDSYAQACGKYGLLAMVTGDEEQARVAIERVAPLAGPDWEAAWKRAFAVRQGQAVGEIPAGVDAHNVTVALIDMASALLAMDELDVFNSIVELLLAHTPTPGPTYETMGLIFDHSGFPDQAAECLITAAQHGHDMSSSSLSALARICAAREMYEDAEDFFTAAFRQDPESQARCLDLATFQSSQGRYQDAADTLKVGLAVWPHSTILKELRESMTLMAAATPT